jgi:hypothetical protein
MSKVPWKVSVILFETCKLQISEDLCWIFCFWKHVVFKGKSEITSNLAYDNESHGNSIDTVIGIMQKWLKYPGNLPFGIFKVVFFFRISILHLTLGNIWHRDWLAILIKKFLVLTLFTICKIITCHLSFL